MSERWHKIGPYSVQRLIRTGGGGSVYLARDARLNRRVALKLIPLPPGKLQREQVLFEARTLAHLNHKGIVQIHDVVESREFLVLVMEYIPGCDLEAFLASEKPALETSLRLVAAICASLSAAHRMGVVHRDLKPANILMDVRGKVILGDFGIACSARESGEDPGPRQLLVPGSVYAMSPEHIRGDHLDQRSDLFSLGLLLFRMLAGRHPFSGACDEGEFLDRVLQEPAPDLSGQGVLPPTLCALLSQLLDKDPEKRPQSAVEVRQRTLEILRELPVSHASPGPPHLAGLAREADSADTGVELPAGVREDVRSHLFPLRRWGRGGWPLPGPLVLTGLAVSTMTLIFVLFTFLGQWLRSAPLEVEVYRPIVVGSGPGNAPAYHQLEDMLVALVNGDKRLRLARGRWAPGEGGEALSLQVRCNGQLCGAQLTRRAGDERMIAYQSLMPDASAEAWQASLRQALDQVYKGG